MVRHAGVVAIGCAALVIAGCGEAVAPIVELPRQLTVAESIGVEGRGGYYEEAGTTRDMVQNHMFQLLCLTVSAKVLE